ncbi:Pls/PosA family non-ribosomal peptide synthetase [Corynebacterium tapiri]|uniref:Amino acid adenylation domain-containing protein n=1 Tax=Corynebacterium tapiri TaxID=1448266 RepID=A0A5C4U2X6_9CORY|nr:Pls/PosA family non-ribosomal peptide synthetase [Corynebacterium tapiri]TNL96026.1 amino acid adenylation domain-containing protein [Corynebacterium tapiri]
MASIPAQYLRGDEAAPVRTLYDILADTAEAHPEAAAIDDGEVTTYSELMLTIDAMVGEMHAQGVRRGDRIGVRMTSGRRDLYLAILATIAAGCAYVPVDADDPDERAELVFTEAGIDALFTDEGLRMLSPLGKRHRADTLRPQPDDTAWIIFTSGSTGKPKGVAVSHRSAAAFVDAESRLFCQDNPLGPEDRVLAGLSVAFDASCEEMWLAWAHGACLVPAPRKLVRSGMDLGPWLIRRDITVVSTVPTLAGLWPAEALDNVRLLIVGGEACSQELVERLATPDREMWNTYGPTEATVVASAQRLYPGLDVGIGLPLDGWDLAVVDTEGNQVAMGEVGELVIGGVGLASYLDPEKDAEKYAPAPKLGWERAYRTGDHVRLLVEGLAFVGRVDDQVKIGGRRIELGEVEAAVAKLENVYNSAVAVQTTGADQKVLVAYVSLEHPERGFDHEQAAHRLVESMPAALVPRVCVMDELPVRTSGKVDKKALPWPLPDTRVDEGAMTATEAWLAQLWVDILATSVSGPDDDFFELGGSSLAASSLIAKIRERVPTIAVRDLYDHPRLGALAEHIQEVAANNGVSLQHQRPKKVRRVRPVKRRARVAQTLINLAVMTLYAATPLAWFALISTAAHSLGMPWAVHTPWWLAILLVVVFATPLGRLPIGAIGARMLTAGIRPGTYRRGSAAHLRVWAAERWADASGSRDIAGSTWVNYYARFLGVKVKRGVDLHSLPPVTGMLSLGKHCSVEPEVDLSGYWLDGDILRVGRISIGANARVGTRSTLLPGTSVAAGAHLEAGSTLMPGSRVKAGSRWAGSPAVKVGRSKHRFPGYHPPRRSRWVWVFGATSVALSAQPVIAAGLGIAATLGLVAATGGNPYVGAVLFAPIGALVFMAAYALMTLIGVRLCGRGLRPGVAPVRSAQGWKLWTTERLMDEARTVLFPLYAGQLTPKWMRALGARVGQDVEISTAVMVPALTEVRDGAFLADDTMVGGYELGGGWTFTGETVIGKRSFLGNSSITHPGRKLPKNSLVAVQSSTPKKAKAGSNWWGSPPERMRRVANSAEDGETRTYSPTRSVKIMRGCIETLRLLAPMASAMILALCLGAAHYVHARLGLGAMFALGGVIWMLGGALAVAIAVVAKWVCVGAHRPGDHALFSSFVWLNELQDAFIEAVAAPWFFVHAVGTGEHNIALRLLGAKIGRGAWVETYWLPETDLCHIGRGATVGPGTVVQTHLFQDRVMSLDTVTLAPGATLGAHSVMLPASHVGEGAVVGPGSLVMRGDQVPAGSSWQGNPIEPRRI